MKKIFVFIFLAAFAFACKKDGSGGGSGKWLLSKEFRKGLLETEFIYNTEGKLVRLNFFGTGGGLSTLSLYRLYDYDDQGRISQALHFSKDHLPTVRRVYTYSPQGKLTRIDEASDFSGSGNLDAFDHYEVYTYNASGELENMTRRLKNSSLHYYMDFTYDNKGSLIAYESWYLDDGDVVLKQKGAMVPGDKAIPDHWKPMMAMPIDLTLNYLYDVSQKYTSYYSGPESVSDWTFTNRKYNNQGYLISQTLEIVSDGSFLGASEFTYEYVQ